MDIIIGTSNKGKIWEIAAILYPMGYNLVPQSMPVDEIGDTIEENAIEKAFVYSKANPDKYIIAEDSGLVVPNLNGLPGPYSARFHTVKLDDNLNILEVPKEEYTTDKTVLDKLNNERLLNLIKANLSSNETGAYFEVCFAVVLNGRLLYICSDRAYGHITAESKGDNGFGYDPIFIGVDTFGKTYAELDNSRKNLRSHRKKALKKLGLWISQNIPNN